MGNPFYNKFGNNAPVNNPFANIPMINMMEAFQQFGSSFQGNPQESVQELLNSGKMTQEQFNYFSSIATPFMEFMKKFKRWR